jgi:hypothetical protein
MIYLFDCNILNVYLEYLKKNVLLHVDGWEHPARTIDASLAGAMSDHVMMFGWMSYSYWLKMVVFHGI